MKIKFLPQNLVVEGTPDKTLLKIATENHLEIRSICKGVPSCAECRVRVVEGDTNILPPSKAELSLIGSSYFIDGRRLSCQVRCFGDVTIDLTEQVERADTQVKKIRGFRSNKQMESRAVNDTMLLTEKPELAKQEFKDDRASDAAVVPDSADVAEEKDPGQAKENQNRGERQQGRQDRGNRDRNDRNNRGDRQRNDRQQGARSEGGSRPNQPRNQSQNQNQKSGGENRQAKGQNQGGGNKPQSNKNGGRSENRDRKPQEPRTQAAPEQKTDNKPKK